MKNYLFGIFNVDKPLMSELTEAKRQYNMATDYYFGNGVAKNHKLALEYFTKSAEQGDVSALATLGRLYYLGNEMDDVKQDYKKAVEFLQKSENAETSHHKCPIHAYHMLGFCYFDGRGVPQDYDRAFRYFMKGVYLACDAVLLCMGICYKIGKGAPQSDVNALKYFELSAKLGNKTAQFHAGVEYQHLVNFEKARKYYEQSAKQGHILAHVNLGILYLTGLGVSVDHAKALEYFQIGIKQNNDVAQWMLGVCYHGGYGVAQDPIKGLEYFELSAKQGNKYAKQSIERVMQKK